MRFEGEILRLHISLFWSVIMKKFKLAAIIAIVSSVLLSSPALSGPTIKKPPQAVEQIIPVN
jgi:hypothetical protein